jgi:hypothetical protein
LHGDGHERTKLHHEDSCRNPPQEAFEAIGNARGCWSGDIQGETAKLDDEFTYNIPDVYWCKMRITEFVPGKKVVWQVLDSNLSYTKARNEWNNTQITFDISQKDGKTEVHFTHFDLVSAYECYNDCSDAWGMLVNGNLRKLIATGKDQPSPFAKEK